MADLEQLALKRDRGFVIRLVLLLLVGLIGSAFVYGQLIGDSTTGCVARTISGATVGSETTPGKAATDNSVE